MTALGERDDGGSCDQALYFLYTLGGHKQVIPGVPGCPNVRSNKPEEAVSQEDALSSFHKCSDNREILDLDGAFECCECVHKEK